MPTKLFEAHLNVTQLERSVKFYDRVVGLERAHYEPERRIAFFWIGGHNASMLGLWEKPAEEVVPHHTAFEIGPLDLPRHLQRLQEHGVQTTDFFGRPSKEPTVFAWMPAAGIYFHDPDGHQLEYIFPLDGPARPELGVVSLSEWQRLGSS